jgi:Fe-S cluster assembly ATPase SufC
MLKISNLRVRVGTREVLKGINLNIDEGETFILFGPNGSGKTTLLMTLMGFGGYTVTAGKIVFKGVDITEMPTYERARLGIGMSFQRPPTIHGLKTRHLVSMCARGREIDVEGMARSGLIITHTGYILDYVNADRGQVMYNGVLCCDTRPTRPRDILDHIGKYGYKECIRCLN